MSYDIEWHIFCKIMKITEIRNTNENFLFVKEESNLE